MASLIPGFEYDIFISYRQKDNKGDRWVSEFVEALKTELESTFKEEISVYFDINPHDGLLETNDVDASLKEKLKCLVFIPIISRTYCDPKSFAWEHEFKVFVEQARQDQYGLKVKLPNGNVANRVLPVRIHDLDSVDIKLCEDILDGVLRGVEFIYKEPGVNRSLTSDDDENKNLNKTKYKNQINKIALAINEIIQGLKTEPEWLRLQLRLDAEKIKQPEDVRKKKKKLWREKPAKLSKRKLLTGGILLAVLLIIAAIFTYPKIFKRDTLERLRSLDGRISIAVMPFQNMTNDTTWNVWQNGIQMNLISSLSNSEELVVRQVGSINDLIKNKGISDYASITPSIASNISRKLEADIFIYGDINKAGKTIRVNAQLINSKTEQIFKSFQIETTAIEDSIFPFLNLLSTQLNDYLILSHLKKNDRPDFRKFEFTTSPKAYMHYNYGQNAISKGDFYTAREHFKEAVKSDSNFMLATIYFAIADINLGFYNEGKECCLKAYKKSDQMSLYMKNRLDYINALYTIGPLGSIKYLKQLIYLDDQDPTNYHSLGWAYNALHQYDKAIPEFEKALDLWDKWGSKPMWVYNYTLLGFAYHKTGQYKKEKKLYKKAEQDFPDQPLLIFEQAVLALTLGDAEMANDFIKKYISLSKENSASEASILTSLANIYYNANLFDKAEKYYRQALSLEPENTVRINSLAYFLIDKDRNVNEGMELVDRALKLQPDSYSYLHTKGWGLYKQGKYNEALEILQKSWDLRREKAIYNHEAWLHLEAAKKAVAGQK